jgi:glyoxylase-like metal-dependent hydrolase (beta-lactamase superfamily II)
MDLESQSPKSGDARNSLVTIDLQHRNHKGYIAACLLDSTEGVLLLDPGPSCTLENLRRELLNLGIQDCDIRAILLTHIHVDHAGATGSLCERNPRIRVYVHEKGVPHMVNPERLLRSATRALGKNVEEFWGPFKGVPAGNIVPLKGGEDLTFGQRKLEVLYTPGHAVHHISFFEADSNVAFVGDATGIRLSDLAVYPATPPPDIQPGDIEESLDLIFSRRPAQLFLTHFGLKGNVEWHLADLRNRLRHWSDFVRQAIAQGKDDLAGEREFAQMVKAEIASIVSKEEAGWFDESVASRQNWHGLARYWRERVSASGLKRG